ncbi:hypothetical protein C0558_00915 [Serratia marcescens]|uniref:hypothetical protein n=1 Tax=Serratia marcescens TaxID=615 RepID=UPI000CA303EA|nr:hypothetical protein [Serratia marcescens]AUO00415.1 hypothetical protein C0558_00915 [Serratia marcescens]
MDIKPARKQLRFATSSFIAMQSAKNFDDFEMNWSNFLSYIEQVFDKVRIACSTMAKNYASFISPINAQRAGDPLLVYLKQARNAVHHGVQETAKQTPAHMRYEIGAGNMVIENLEIEDGKPIKYSGNLPLETYVIPERIVAVDFDNRGVRYKVPASHLGKDLADNHPLTLATLALDYYSDFLDKVEGELINK